MRDNKGFVFIETILTIVVLTTTLVILYTNYSRALIAERRRLYYDDISYVYRTAVIRDVVNETINTAQWDAKVDEMLTKQYIYVFNYESQIFLDNELLKNTRKNFNYNQLIYIPMGNVATVKRCINGGDSSVKCKRTLTVIEGYSDATFKDYLKAIYVPYDRNKRGILISLIYESKDGSAAKIETYDHCIQRELFNKLYGDDSPSISEDEKKQALINYKKDGSYSLDMRCENAYYNSWVYL